MKKLIFFCTVMMAGFMANAQLSYGVKAGLNVANLSNSVGGKALVGYHGGGLVNYAVSEKFALQAELLYSGQGCRYKVADFGFVSLNQNVNLDYINIPILAQYYFAPSFYVEAGPQIGFLASAKDDAYEKEDNDGRSYKENLKSTDFSAGVGLGYIFTKINLGIGARYTFGFSNINKKFDDEETIKNHNNVFQIGAFYRFGKKK